MKVLYALGGSRSELAGYGYRAVAMLSAGWVNIAGHFGTVTILRTCTHDYAFSLPSCAFESI